MTQDGLYPPHDLFEKPYDLSRLVNTPRIRDLSETILDFSRVEAGDGPVFTSPSLQALMLGRFYVDQRFRLEYSCRSLPLSGT
jgi:hypothetical protein